MCVRVGPKMRAVLLFVTLALGVSRVQARPKRSACKAILAEVNGGRWKDMPQDIITECRLALQSTRHHGPVGDEGAMEYANELRLDAGEPRPEDEDYVKTTRRFIRTLIKALSGLSINLKHMKATQRQADHGKTWKP
ncbi:uncharacterized protein [Branchiostoma lanceolatum]|uniref:uncharacterized protein n=1 Tax=Branchiostoma lanceolatum TaxID=7740 RepID=UPI003452C786